MEFQNEYTLIVDIKRYTTSIVPVFVQYDTATLIFKIYDDGLTFDLSKFTRAEVAHQLPDRKTVIGDGKLITLPTGEKAIQYNYLGSEMSQVGNVLTSLSVFNGDEKVSVLPFVVKIVSDLRDEFVENATEEVGLLQELIAKITSSLVTAEENNKKIAKILEDIKDSVEFLDDAILKENERQTKEAARIVAETSRSSSESTRITSENARIASETIRDSKEQTRQANETDRVSKESKRETNEAARIAKESTRQTDEDSRKSSETTRISNESSRQSMETARSTAENNRTSAESLRQSNEDIRKTNETARVNAEDARISKESERIAKETIRLGAETNRNESEITRKANEDARLIEEANRKVAEINRSNAENSRDEHENERILNEISRLDSEDVRTGNENARIENEVSRTTEESTRSLNETNRKSNETARIASESERLSAEVIRVTNEDERIKNETARLSSESERIADMSNRIHKGTYSPTTSYMKHNEVNYGGSTWRCLEANTGEIPSESSSFWTLVSQRGIDGKGSVVSVNGVSPNLSGDVILLPVNIGAANELHEHGIHEITDLENQLSSKANTADLDITNSNLTNVKNMVDSLGTASTRNIGTTSGTVPVVGSDGKLDATIIPSIQNTVTSVAGKIGEVILNSTDVGLGNVTNESKTTMFTSPTFTGTPIVPTATSGTNNTQIASTAFVTTAIANKTSVTGNAGTATKLETGRTISLSGVTSTATSFDGTANISIPITAIPATLLTGTASISTTGNAGSATKLATVRTINGVNFDGTANITITDSTKAPLSSPALTGTPTAPTATATTNNTQIATTAFATTAITNHNNVQASISQKGHVQLNDTLTSTSITEALTANQGKILNDKINGLAVPAELLNHLSDYMPHDSKLNQYASNRDANGLYQIVEYKRMNNTLYMKSALSNTTNGFYETLTWDFYDVTGVNKVLTVTWNLTYDADGKITSKVVTP